MNETNQTPIDEKFLTSGDLFALKYSNGYVFFRVEMWEQLQYKPFVVGDVPPGQNSGFSRLEDQNGDDILHVDKEDEKVLHAGIGMAPADIARFTNYPESENRLRTFPNLTVPSSRSGSLYGDVDGDLSPYEQPTDAEELFIPPDVHLDFDFLNPSETETKTVQLNLRAREYSVRTLQPSRNQDPIRRVMSPGSPIPIAPVGSPDNQARSSRNLWDVEPVSESQIQQLMR